MRSHFFPATVLLTLTLSGCASSKPEPCAPSAAPKVSSSAPADGLDALSEEELAHRLLESTGAAGLGKLVLDQTSENFRKLGIVPPEFIDHFKKSVHPEDLVEIISHIYVKNYDRPTMIAAIRFYESEQGTVMIAKLPTVTKESMDAGRAWGEEIGRKALQEMNAQHPPAASP